MATNTHILNVYWKNAQILTNFQTSWFPSAGRLLMASRVGGNTANIEVDNVHIVTFPVATPLAGPPTGLPDGGIFTLEDSGTSGVVATNKPITVEINGAPVSSTFSKAGAVTTIIAHNFPTLYPAGSTNTGTLMYSDTLGRSYTNSISFVIPAYPIVNSAWAVTGVDTTKPGFRIKTWQSGFEWNIIPYAQEQLAGLHGTNQADTSTFKDNGFFDFATAPGPQGPLGVINMDYGAGGDGWFTPTTGYGDNMWPGLTSGANGLAAIDHCAADMQFFLKLPAGVYKMGVDSDDNFMLSAGPNPSDWGALNVGEFNGAGGRGWNAGDTDFYVAVTNAGIYPFRLVWENGTGGANCEWFTVNDSGIRTLIGDPDPTNTTGIVMYYAGPTLPAYVSWEYPTPGSTLGDAILVAAQITDAGTTFKSGSAQLTVNGTAVVDQTVTSTNGVTTVYGYVIPALAASASATAQLVYSTSAGGPFTNTWSYTVPSFTVLNAAWAVTGVNTTKPGFRIRAWQSGAQPNNIQYTQEQLAGLQGDNNVDPTLFNEHVYSQTYTDYNGVINFNISGQAGDFQTYDDYGDMAFIGIPALNTGLTGSMSVEGLCYLYFDHPGLYTMGVNSDDGFMVTAGANPADWLTQTVLGQYNGGRGQATTSFSFVVTNAGFYPFRLIYENGNGELPGNGAELKWFMVEPTGSPALLNDPRIIPNKEFGYAYAYYSGPLLPAFISVAEPYPGSSGVVPNAGFQVRLTDGGSTVSSSSVKLFINGQQLSPVISKASGVTTAQMPAAYLLPQGSDTAMVVYTTTGTGGGTFTNSWSFTVMNWGGLNPAWAVTGVDTTKPGWLVRPWKSSGEPNASEPNEVLRWTEEQMAGAHGKNFADLSLATDHGYIDFAGSGTNVLINWNNSGTAGNFTTANNYPDLVFPGSGGATTWDNSAEEVICYMNFSQPGLYEMGVNSDDGFSVKAGANPKDWLNSTLCGYYEGGRGSSDTDFFINVTNAGTYPIRLLWENGGGGFNCEWFVWAVDPATLISTRFLINDPNAPSGVNVAAYYVGPSLPAYVSEYLACERRNRRAE